MACLQRYPDLLELSLALRGGVVVFEEEGDGGYGIIVNGT